MNKLYFEADLKEFEKLGNRNYFLFWTTVDDICQRAGYYSEEPHLYILDEGKDPAGALFLVMSWLADAHLMGYLKVFLYERDDGVIENTLKDFYSVEEKEAQRENKVFDLQKYIEKDKSLCKIFIDK